MKRYQIYVYEIGDEYLYEVIKEDNADTALIKLIEAVNRYGCVRIRWELRIEG